MYAEDFVVEDAASVAARARAAELAVTCISPGAARAITVLAAASGAHSVVEIGTGTGVTSLALLAGMDPQGVLTTLDLDAEHQRAARQAFIDAAIRPGRTRPITGRPTDVVRRLADATYDMVVVGGTPLNYPDHVAAAHRLLRVGGTLVLTHATWHDAVADPARRDEPAATVRGVGKDLAADERFVTSLLPVGDGLLVAVKR